MEGKTSDNTTAKLIVLFISAGIGSSICANIRTHGNECMAR